MELNGIIGAFLLASASGLLCVRNPSLAFALLAFALPFDRLVIRETPFTIYSSEALLAGVLAGALIGRFHKIFRGRDSGVRVWIPSLLVLAGWGLAFPGALDRVGAAKELVRWAELWMVLPVLALLLRRGEVDGRVVAGGYLAGTAIIGAMILAEIIFFPVLSRPSVVMPPNAISPYMGLGLLFMVLRIRPRFGGYDQAVQWGIGILLVLSLLASQSRTGIAAVVLGLLVALALARRPARKTTLAVAGVIVVVLSVTALLDSRVRTRLSSYATFWKVPAFQERLVFYGWGVRMWQERPVVGAGPGCYRKALGKFMDDNPAVFRRMSPAAIEKLGILSHIHNLFIQLAIESGLAGLGAWLGALAVLGFLLAEGRAGSSHLFAGGAGLMAVFLFSNLLDITLTHSRGVLFAVGWGIFLGAGDIRKGKKKKGAG